MRTISFLRIAGLTVALRTDDPAIHWTWDEASRRFLVADGVPDLDLTVEAAGALAPAEGTVRFESGAVWRLVRTAAGHAIECRSSAFGETPYKIATLDEDFTRGRVVVRRDVLSGGRHPLEYPLDEVLVTNLLGRGRGVELHACGVVDARGRGHVFAGMSGAGKTTTARLWNGDARDVVSDDRVVVRERDGVPWMYGTPWHGEAALASAASAPVAGIYLLVQAPEIALRTLAPAEAAARLFACSFPLFYDAAALDFTLGFLDRLAGAVPVRELRFTRDRAVVDAVLREAR